MNELTGPGEASETSLILSSMCFYLSSQPETAAVRSLSCLITKKVNYIQFKIVCKKISSSSVSKYKNKVFIYKLTLTLIMIFL